MFVVEAVGVGSLFADPIVMGKTARDTNPYVTEEGLYDVSDKSNVVLFLLDWYDNAVLESLLDANPNMLDENGERVADGGESTEAQQGQDDAIGSSDAPISQFDLHATIMKAMTGDGSKYGTAFEDVDAGAPRTRMYVHPTAELANESDFIEYEIDGYALDFNNWHATGMVWE